MALVRCTCIAELVYIGRGSISLNLSLPDPDCGYVWHRLAADVAAGSESETRPG